jgi:hypothetical protein
MSLTGPVLRLSQSIEAVKAATHGPEATRPAPFCGAWLRLDSQTTSSRTLSSSCRADTSQGNLVGFGADTVEPASSSRCNCATISAARRQAVEPHHTPPPSSGGYRAGGRSSCHEGQIVGPLHETAPSLRNVQRLAITRATRRPPRAGNSAAAAVPPRARPCRRRVRPPRDSDAVGSDGRSTGAGLRAGEPALAKRPLTQAQCIARRTSSAR